MHVVIQSCIASISGLIERVFIPICKEDGMKHISKKTWFALSVAIVAISAVFALKKPVQKEKSSHVVVDRLVNQLVCKIASGSGSKGYRYPRGVLGFTVSTRGDRQRPGSDEYTLRSS